MRVLFLIAVSVAALFAVTSSGEAALTGGPHIIPAPASTEDDAPGAENEGQQAFDERECAVLAEAVEVDGGQLPAGTVVDSHMIFLNPVNSVETISTETWTFLTPVVATLSDMNGDLEAASNDIFGAPGTVYPGSFFGRGMDIGLGDSFTVTANSVEATMKASAPGDWMRVLTEATCEGAIWGDHNCSDSADPIDSLLTLRHDAGLEANTGDCPEMGQVVDVVNASEHAWGDVDCGGEVTPVDSLKLLRYDAGLSVSQEVGCPAVGSAVYIGE